LYRAKIAVYDVLPVCVFICCVCALQRNEKGESPLHRACIEGSLRKVKLLIDTVIAVY